MISFNLTYGRVNKNFTDFLKIINQENKNPRRSTLISQTKQENPRITELSAIPLESKKIFLDYDYSIEQVSKNKLVYSPNRA